MTPAAASNTDVVFSEGSSDAQGPNVYALPEEYESIRADEKTQFAPLDLKVPEPREPSWFEEWLQTILVWLAELFAPLGSALSSSWGVVQWALVAALAAFVIYLVFRLIGPAMQRIRSATETGTEEPEWQPDEQESLALLEDADRLASQGRYDEAARLLLQRSVGQIAAARPDWVEPSSTARELAALPRLSDAARSAFAVVSDAVEKSLFALHRLSREDWEHARAAYADFALARIDSGKKNAASPSGLRA